MKQKTFFLNFVIRLIHETMSTSLYIIKIRYERNVLHCAAGRNAYSLRDGIAIVYILYSNSLSL